MIAMARSAASLTKIKDPARRIVAVDQALAANLAERQALSALREDTALELNDAGSSAKDIASMLGALEANRHSSGEPISATRVREMIALARQRAGLPPNKVGRPRKQSQPTSPQAD
jgi:hypothetical protein